MGGKFAAAFLLAITILLAGCAEEQSKISWGEVSFSQGQQLLTLQGKNNGGKIDAFGIYSYKRVQTTGLSEKPYITEEDILVSPPAPGDPNKPVVKWSEKEDGNFLIVLDFSDSVLVKEALSKEGYDFYIILYDNYSKSWSASAIGENLGKYRFHRT